MQVNAFAADYSTLMNGITSRAAARIVLLNLPNLAALPYVSGASLQQKQAMQRAAVEMTAVINRLVSPSVFPQPNPPKITSVWVNGS